MNVASLELCKELYELSGSDWVEVNSWWTETGRLTKDTMLDAHTPAYDLGYLLRKLPYSEDTGAMSFGFAKQGHWYLNFILTGIRGAGMQSSYNAEADTPEDAVAKLAIELFKQGIL